jgi:hypothetical protein
MRYTLYTVFLSLAFGVGTLAEADTSSKFQFQPIVPIPLPSGGTLDNCTSLGDYVNAVFQLAITVAIVLAVIMIIIDGFKYMTSDAVGNKKDALGGIRSALFGLIIILACTLILNIIDPDITKITLFNQGGLAGCATPSAVNNINLTGTPSQGLDTSSSDLTKTLQVNDTGSWSMIQNGKKISGPYASENECKNLIPLFQSSSLYPVSCAQGAQ